jgi:hypothetical protein
MTSPADRRTLHCKQAEEMATTSDAAKLVGHQHGTVILAGKGQDRGAKLKPPG